MWTLTNRRRDRIVEREVMKYELRKAAAMRRTEAGDSRRRPRNARRVTSA